MADFTGQPLDKLATSYDLHLITNRVINTTKSRTIANYWLRPRMPKNAILINPLDAQRLGVHDGQQVQVVSATDPTGEWDFQIGQKKPIIGSMKLTETIRPGVIKLALGYGHWATGAADMIVDGQLMKGDPLRGAGIHANAAMWTDPACPNTPLFDPVGGSVSFYDTHVRLKPVAG